MEKIVLVSITLRDFNKMKEYHSKLLKIIDKVSKNDGAESINNILDAGSKHLDDAVDEQKELFKMTLQVVKSRNPKLWFNI